MKQEGPKTVERTLEAEEVKWFIKRLTVKALMTGVMLLLYPVA